MPNTDSEGHTDLTVALDRVPDTTRPLKAELDIAVNDPSGHAAHAHASIPVHGIAPLIGLRSGVQQRRGQRQHRSRFRRRRRQSRWRADRDDGEPTTGARTAGLANGHGGRTPATKRSGARAAGDAATSLRPDAPSHVCAELDCGRYRIEVAKPAAWRSPRTASGLAGRRPTARTCLTGSIFPPTRRWSRRAIRRASISLRRSPARRRCWCCPTRSTSAQPVRAGRWNHGRCAGGGDLGARRLCRRARFPRRRRTRSAPDRAIGLTWVGVDPRARTLPVAIDATRQDAAARPPERRRRSRGGRLGQRGRGGRRHSTADPLRLP